MQLLRPHLPGVSGNELLAGIGFGFASKTNDFKITKIRLIWDFTDLYWWTRKHEVEICSLGKDSWKKLDVTVPGTIRSVPYYYPFNNFSSKNGCHCSVKGKDGCPVVLSLDFSSETLRTPSLPDECVISRNYDDICKKFVLLKESITMVLVWIPKFHWRVEIRNSKIRAIHN